MTTTEIAFSLPPGTRWHARNYPGASGETIIVYDGPGDDADEIWHAHMRDRTYARQLCIAINSAREMAELMDPKIEAAMSHRIGGR